MYVLVHHTIHDPVNFWATAQENLAEMPAHLQLHHSLSAKDGTRATCLWEADSVGAVQQFLDPLLGSTSTNEYREAENREGVVVPEKLRAMPT